MLSLADSRAILALLAPQSKGFGPLSEGEGGLGLSDAVVAVGEGKEIYMVYVYVL